MEIKVEFGVTPTLESLITSVLSGLIGGPVSVKSDEAPVAVKVVTMAAEPKPAKRESKPKAAKETPVLDTTPVEIDVDAINTSASEVTDISGVPIVFTAEDLRIFMAGLLNNPAKDGDKIRGFIKDKLKHFGVKKVSELTDAQASEFYNEATKL